MGQVKKKQLLRITFYVVGYKLMNKVIKVVFGYFVFWLAGFDQTAMRD
jgi:hypothetical protein